MDRVLSTQLSLLPRLMTWLLPGHVVIAFLKVTQSASGVSHDLQHITFLNTNIMKRSQFLSLFPVTQMHIKRHTCPVRVVRSNTIISPQTESAVFHGCLMCEHQAGVTVVSVAESRGSVEATWTGGLSCSLLSLWARVTQDHHHQSRGFAAMSSS